MRCTVCCEDDRLCFYDVVFISYEDELRYDEDGLYHNRRPVVVTMKLGNTF